MNKRTVYTVSKRRLCPVCGEKIKINGKTTDGRAIGTCGDAFQLRPIRLLPIQKRVLREIAKIPKGTPL